MLQVNKLCYVREGSELFSDLSFSITAGDLVQIEGQNGAGKTTLLRSLAGLTRPESGQILWQGQDVTVHREHWHRQFIWLGHASGCKIRLTPMENLQFWSPASSKKQIESALDAVNLAGYDDVAVGHLSAGQQRRVALARLWLTDSLVWILDEPFTALDQLGIDLIITRILAHCQQGGMAIVTTHQPMTVENACLKKIKLAEFTC